MSLTITRDQAKNGFDDILDRVVHEHEEVLISDNGTPVARVTHIEERVKRERIPGRDAGKVRMSDDFFDPLPDDFVDAFYQ
jgi:prevent-host-death family protein